MDYEYYHVYAKHNRTYLWFDSLKLDQHHLGLQGVWRFANAYILHYERMVVMNKSKKILPFNKNAIITSGAGHSQRISMLTDGEENDNIGIVPYLSWEIDGGKTSEGRYANVNNLKYEPYLEGIIIKGNKFQDGLMLSLYNKACGNSSVKVRFQWKILSSPWSWIGVYAGKSSDGYGFGPDNYHIYKHSNIGFYKSNRSNIGKISSNCINDDFWMTLKVEGNKICSHISGDNRNWQLLSEDIFDYDGAYDIGIAFCPNEAEFYNWFFMNYVQFASQTTFDYGDWSPISFYIPMYYHKMPFIDIYRIKKSILIYNKIDLVDFIKINIDDNKYCDIEIDEFYIKGMDAFEKYHVEQYVTVYGYDNSEEILYIMGYNEDGRFFTTVNYIQFDLASRDINHEGIIYLTFQEQSFASYLFDINIFVLQLEEYVKSNNISNRFKQIYLEEREYSYGISVYDTILKDEINFNTFLCDERLSHFLYEHKKIMNLSILFLYARNYINSKDFELHRDKTLKLEKEALVVRNLVLKNMIQPSERMVNRIIISLNRIREEEKHCILQLIDSIRKHMVF